MMRGFSGWRAIAAALALLLAVASVVATAAAAPAPEAAPCHDARGDPHHGQTRRDDGLALRMCCALHCAAAVAAVDAPGRAGAASHAPRWRLVDSSPRGRTGERIERPPRAG